MLFHKLIYWSETLIGEIIIQGEEPGKYHKRTNGYPKTDI